MRLIALRDDERLVRIARIVESEVNGDETIVTRAPVSGSAETTDAAIEGDDAADDEMDDDVIDDDSSDSDDPGPEPEEE